MNWKWFFIATIIIIGSSISCFFLKPWRYFHPQYHLIIKGPYFKDLSFKETCADIPTIEIEVENKKIAAIVDLGSGQIMALPGNFLQELSQKSFLKQVFSYGVRGKKYYSNLYEIPKVQIGDISIYRAVAEEINQEFIMDTIFGKKTQESPNQNLARIGWRIFSIFNMFIDFENHKIAFCDSLDTLKKKGYPVDSFIETPLFLDRELLEFYVTTNKGKMRCVLDTGCTLNFLNKDLENGSNAHMIFNPDNIDQHAVLNPNNSDLSVCDLKDTYDIPVFKIGKKDFGKTTFTKIKMPLEIDAFVGMDFLRSKLVFIDFPNHKLYFYEKQN